MASFNHILFKEQSAQSLAVFRAMFGFFVFWAASLTFIYGEGSIVYKYYKTPIHFKYQFFEWVHPWPEIWMMYATYWALLLFSAFVMIGLYYYFSIFMTTLIFTYLFLLDEIYYLNHYYLIIVIGVLMCFLPMNRQWALDCYRNPSWKKNIVPNWSILSVKTLVEAVLIFAGIAKLNYDWLYNLEPLRMWLQHRQSWHVFGDLINQDWFIATGAYWAVGLHIFGAPLLFFQKTRLPIFLLYCAFHLTNSYTFDIGVFPFFTILATTIFFKPDWPSVFVQNCARGLNRIEKFYKNRSKPKSYYFQSISGQKILIGFVSIWIFVQLALPLRHFFYPGDPSWTEEGHKYAWHMKLRDKSLFILKLKVVDTKTNRVWILDRKDIIKHGSYNIYNQVSKKPQMLVQFVKFLERKWQDLGYEDVEIYADTLVSLNKRGLVRLIDPEIDLTTQEWGVGHSDFVLTYEEGKKYEFSGF